MSTPEDQLYPAMGVPGQEIIPGEASTLEAPPEAMPAPPENDESLTKSELQGWRGGLPVKLSRKMKSGEKLRDELALHLSETLALELDNHKQRVEKLKVWNRQYKGKRDKKTFPNPNCANVAVPLTRSNVDTIQVRLDDSVWNKRRIFLLKSRVPDKVALVRDYEDALDWICKNMIRLKDRMRPSQQESVKFGTGCGKLVFERRPRTVYRYATVEEEADPAIEKYALEGTTRRSVKYVDTTYEGPAVYSIAREDFIISAEATDIQEAYMVGFRMPLRKPQLRQKARAKLYDKKAVDRLLGGDWKGEHKGRESGTADDHNDNAKARAESKDIKIDKTDYEKPFQIWELWLKYDVDEDGEEDDIVVTYHKESGEILSCIYNPLFYGFRPFYATRFYPTEHSFDGEGICEILAPIQDMVDTLFNQFIDFSTIQNAPPIFVRSGTPLEKLKYLSPGKIYPCDDNPEDMVYVPELGRVAPDVMNLIQFLISIGDRACGITPAVQGISTSERPVFKETSQLLEEANKKFLYGQRQHQNDLTNVGRMILEIMAQYRPEFTYSVLDPQTGAKTEKQVYFDAELIRNWVDVELEAATELMSMETRREIRMAEYQLMSDFMTKMAGMVQAFTSPEVPSEMKKSILEGATVSVEIIKRIVRDFDERDPDKLVYDPFGKLDIQKCIMQSADIIAEQQQMAAQQGGGMPPGGDGGGMPGGPESGPTGPEQGPPPQGPPPQPDMPPPGM